MSGHASRQRESVAVIGGGIGGLVAAFLLNEKYHVTVYEQNAHLGGHAETITLTEGTDAGLTLDIGFMVFNSNNYPAMHALLRDLGGIDVGETDMSFSYCSNTRNIQYGFSNPGNNSAFKQAFTNPLPEDRDRVALLKEIIQFGLTAAQSLEHEELSDLTLGDYLAQKNASNALVDFYIVPSAAAIWSTASRTILDFPVATYLKFMNNHGMLTRRNMPKWEYVRGGSQTYVKGMLDRLEGPVYRGVKVEQVIRRDAGVTVKADGMEHTHDYAVIATHADQALRLLADPTDDEKRLLGAWTYQTNHAVLHSDPSIMPRDRSLWAAWNYSEEAGNEGSTVYRVTYYLNVLQGHVHAAKPYFLSLCEQDDLVFDDTLYRTSFTHPLYTFASVGTQAQLPSLNGPRRTYFCGSYFGYGFHEDAIVSGRNVARALGITT